MSAQGLQKGEEIWFVQIEGYTPNLPRINHGVVIGGGQAILIVAWDLKRRPDRITRGSLEHRVFRTKIEAVDDGRERLNRRREAAEKAILECIRQLGVLDEVPT